MGGQGDLTRGAGRPHALVVGGGLAGMAAALALADGGARVTLLEARRWLGGATSSFERDGLVVDTGQHVFLRCCTAYRAFLGRLGVSDRTSLQPWMDIPVLSPGRPPARLRRDPLPAPLHLARALARYRLLSPAERAGAVRAAMALRRLDPKDPHLDRRTFGEWLREHGQSERAVRSLWDLFALPALNLPAARASLALAVKVFRTGLLDRADAADIGVPLVPLGELHGEAGRRALERAGVRVRLGSRVRAVLTGPEGATGVALNDGTLEGDVVVVAVPNDRAGALLPPGALPADPAGLGLSPIVNVHVVYDRPVTRLAFAAVVGSPVQWVFDRTAPSGLDRGQYLAVSLSGAEELVDRPVEWFRRTFLPALAALFPRAREARVERFLVTRERGATFRQAPGTAALRPGPQALVPRLYVAGAWTDTGWPATMEGAVRSGLAAARRALVALGRTGRLPAEVAA
ncbi:MAG TPA: hydroxysqualene dehydroxylase HpnE [Actinomycetota bacterium]|nr:hydroxysqualene dehydroxylase HpnE [Actinomycetota bacterium]